MIHIINLVKRYGTKDIFNGVSAHIPPKSRVGLVGANGSGKTTLLRIIVGEEEADEGDIIIRKDAQVCLLKQEVWDNPNRGILEETLDGFPEIQAIEKELFEIQRRITQNHSQELLEQYSKAQHLFEVKGGYEVEHRAKAVLCGMGFTPEQFNIPMKVLSGGWMMRVALAKLLLSQPAILLLDEPTNHLDLEAIVWLEGFLLEYPGTIIFTTHDQTFMEKVADHIIEINHKQLTMFVGSFEHFIEEKALYLKQLEASYKNQQKKIQEEERFIERFRYKATKARQVQSRIKMLNKIKRVDIVRDISRVMKFNLPQPQRSGEKVVDLLEVTRRYGEKRVYEGLDFSLMRGEKVVLIGPNGAGKSTLLKIIAGVIDIQSGEVVYGHNVTTYYYAQHQLEILNPRASILEDLELWVPGFSNEERRALLGAFLFSGDEVFKPISVLSGGEKARVVLAKMLCRPANFLIMDEPTNHLDIPSRQVLEDALADFTGTIIFNSHDRAFINAVATCIVEVKNGKLHRYPGDYDHYLWKKAQEETAQTSPARQMETCLVLNTKGQKGESPGEKEKRRLRAERIQEKSRQLNPLRERLSALESEIAALETEEQMTESALCDLTVMEDTIRYPKTIKRHNEIRSRLRNCYEEWESLAQQIEDVRLAYEDE